MSAATRAPDELWASIFCNLDAKRDKPTILALRLVGKRFCRLVDPLVYCKIDAVAGKHPFEGWIEQLAEDPDLTRFVREASFQFIYLERAYSFKSDDDRRKKQIETLLQRVKIAHDSLKDVEADSAEAQEKQYMELSLLVCENLEAITFHSATDCLWRHFKSFFARMSEAHLVASLQDPKTPGFLRNVSTFNAPDKTMTETANVPFVLQLLSLPRLRSLSIGGLVDVSFPAPKTPLRFDSRKRNNNPIELHFDSCMLTPDGVAQILVACGNVKSLHIRWRPGLWNRNIANAPLGQAIRKHTSRLQHLVLDSTPCWIDTLARQGQDSFGSFADTMVRSLALPHASFWSHPTPRDFNGEFNGEFKSTMAMAEMLPKTLERLYILGIDKEEEIELFKALLQHPKLPRLTHVQAIPWFQYSLEESFYTRNFLVIDYNVAPELKFDVQT